VGGIFDCWLPTPNYIGNPDITQYNLAAGWEKQLQAAVMPRTPWLIHDAFFSKFALSVIRQAFETVGIIAKL
jgi:GT2 family glycosyltransferase